MSVQCNIVECFDYPSDQEAESILKSISHSGLIVVAKNTEFCLWSERYEARCKRKLYGAVDYSRSFQWLFHIRGKKHFKPGKRERQMLKNARRLLLYRRLMEFINSRRDKVSVARPVDVFIIVRTISIALTLTVLVKFYSTSHLRGSSYVSQDFCPSDSLLPPWSQTLSVISCSC